MRIFGLTVGKNEADRYLHAMLSNTSRYVYQHFFYDDDSTDRTVAAVLYHPQCVVYRREINTPSFMEHEAMFRAAAWAAFEETMTPVLGDWVLILDCDEFFVDRTPLPLLPEYLQTISASGVMLNIHEVFGYDDEGTPLIRIDRLWGTIHAPRLFPYRPGAQFSMQRMGAPAVPTYVMAGPWANTENFSILHYGYARREDQLAKYERYSSRSDNGHSNIHIESILALDKELIPWRP